MNAPPPAVPPWEPGLVPSPDPDTRGRSFRRSLVIATWAVAGAICLAAAVVAAGRAHAEQDRPPTAAELRAAAAASVARRWRAWPAGRLFPARLGYTTDLLSQENAARLAISPGHACAVALVGRAGPAAARAGCVGAVRSTYADQLQGVVYTVGVLAFPDPARAAAFARALAGERLPAGLRAYPVAGTAGAWFTDAVRQAAVTRSRGPYVVLAVSGYADGRPASASTQPRPGVFAPAGQLVGEILGALTKPAVVRCGRPGWSC